MNKIIQLEKNINFLKSLGKEYLESYADVINLADRSGVFFRTHDYDSDYLAFNSLTRFYCPLCKGPCQSFFPDLNIIEQISGYTENPKLLSELVREIYKNFEIDSNHFDFIIRGLNSELNNDKFSGNLSAERRKELEEKKIIFI